MMIRGKLSGLTQRLVEAMVGAVVASVTMGLLGYFGYAELIPDGFIRTVFFMTIGLIVGTILIAVAFTPRYRRQYINPGKGVS